MEEDVAKHVLQQFAKAVKHYCEQQQISPPYCQLVYRQSDEQQFLKIAKSFDLKALQTYFKSL